MNRYTWKSRSSTNLTIINSSYSDDDEIITIIDQTQHITFLGLQSLKSDTHIELTQKNCNICGNSSATWNIALSQNYSRVTSSLVAHMSAGAISAFKMIRIFGRPGNVCAFNQINLHLQETLCHRNPVLLITTIHHKATTIYISTTIDNTTIGNTTLSLQF